ncbi:hypothetical protein AUEXF2481DRAFT_135977 [Aureobasidium subglaciale EXF-2481]|uniref:Uncharacterized protein n=1 Tax=Aureobasidium subglaciale (strain EXF-2481) TaxID=1043005 RepID=A0A074Z242_AURSE|nr:uncharacterized protein AUEXF2481DRAFT_135977 [Aureobasidium subglaciale EXF-2481]KER00418.1 hypothetical protein AUEXF2481DRAFT_135977 [Aureobasidium subglaciale EXF-2481]
MQCEIVYCFQQPQGKKEPCRFGRNKRGLGKDKCREWSRLRNRLEGRVGETTSETETGCQFPKDCKKEITRAKEHVLWVERSSDRRRMDSLGASQGSGSVEQSRRLDWAGVGGRSSTVRAKFGPLQSSFWAGAPTTNCPPAACLLNSANFCYHGLKLTHAITLHHLTSCRVCTHVTTPYLTSLYASP